MVRRSTLVLLGLSICLFVAQLSSASATLKLDESRIRLALGDKQTIVTLPLDNGTGRSIRARVRVELLDPKDKVRASADAEQEIGRGASTVSVSLKLTYAELLESERKEFPWYRLRYRIAPVAAGNAALAVEGTPVFAYKGETLADYWDYTHRIFEFD